ncbi:MAG TPA: hypothetical protein VHQ90_05470 [Thermoanaerobaculia bacterium]|nr:hypothetical protein [Thermoanaerobaculia bacterium]
MNLATGRCRLRVLHLTGEFPPFVWGGLGTAVGGLATASARAGMAVGVLLVGRGYTCYGATVRAPGACADDCAADAPGVEIFQLGHAEAISGALDRVRTLDHGRTGLLFPPKDVDALTHTLVALAASPELRQRLGAAAAVEVRTRWLWRSVVEGVRSVYLETWSPAKRTGTEGSGRLASLGRSR